MGLLKDDIEVLRTSVGRYQALRPAVAMDDHGDGKGSVAGGYAQFTKLQWVGAIRLDKSWP